MNAKFKIRLLTARVSATESHAAGEIISVGNDEAWRMINSARTGELVGKQQSPEMPAAERALQDAADQAAEEARLAEEAKQKAADDGATIAELQQKIAELTEENLGLVAEMEALKAPQQIDLVDGAKTDSSNEGEQE